MAKYMVVIVEVESDNGDAVITTMKDQGEQALENALAHWTGLSINWWDYYVLDYKPHLGPSHTEN